MTGGTVVLSPHADDACFSLGGSLQLDVLPKPIHVVTIFGRTNFLGVWGFQPIEHATRARRAEDFAFADAVGVDLKFLRYPDASLRYGRREADVFDVRERLPMAIPRGLRGRLREVVGHLAPKWILAPLALGGHRDHRATRSMARALSRRAILGYYEDLPYAGRLSERAIQRHVRAVASAHQPWRIQLGAKLRSKLRLIRLYETQVGQRTVDGIRGHALRLDAERGAERLWLPKGVR